MWLASMHGGLFEMNQSELVNQIIRNVHDEVLREELLRRVLDGHRPQPKGSILMHEMEQFGFDAVAVKKNLQWQMRIWMKFGMVFSSLFIIFGAHAMLEALLQGNVSGILFPGMFFGA